MHITIASLSLAAALVAAAASGPAGAQESPSELTRTEQACERAMASGLTAFVVDAGKCLTACREAARDGDDFACGPFSFAYPATLDCLDRADAKATLAITRDCAGDACVDCYFGGDCRTFRAFQFNDAVQFTSLALDALYCDDAFSRDGLNARETRCRQKLGASTGRFVSALSKCAARCHASARAAGRSHDGCRSAAIDTPAADPGLQRCVASARRHFEDACGKRCDDLPDCLPFDCPAIRTAVESQVAFFEPEVYCGDLPRCGDGVVSPSEQCDWAAFPSGCGFDQFCDGTCSCQDFPVCGDGVISAFEFCDGAAVPSGCPGGYFCHDCDHCDPASCGDGQVVPPEVCDPYAPSSCPDGQVCEGCSACVTPPDRCAEATAIPPEGGAFAGTTSGTSGFAGSCGSSPGAPERIFTWTPEVSGAARLSTCTGTDFDTVISVLEGACDVASTIACNDQACGDQSELDVSVTAGETYWIVVDGWSSSSGAFTLSVTPPVASPSGAFLDD